MALVDDIIATEAQYLGLASLAALTGIAYAAGLCVQACSSARRRSRHAIARSILLALWLVLRHVDNV